MFANKHAKILIALVCAVLGFMLATQFKTTERQKTINIQRAEDLSDRLKAVEKERDELSKEMEKLQAKAGDEVVAREIVRLKAFAGDFEMHGKGIKLVLDDSKIASKPAGPTLSVNNNRSAPPYEIKAIGNPNNLESALKLRGGVLENFKFWGIQADLSQSDDIVIPAFKGRKSFEYAKIAEGQASDAEKEAAEK